MSLHVTVRVLYLGFPLNLVLTILSVTLDRDVLEHDFLVGRIVSARKRLLVHDIRNRVLLAMALDDLRGRDSGLHNLLRKCRNRSPRRKSRNREAFDLLFVCLCVFVFELHLSQLANVPELNFVRVRIRVVIKDSTESIPCTWTRNLHSRRFTRVESNSDCPKDPYRTKERRTRKSVFRFSLTTHDLCVFVCDCCPAVREEEKTTVIASHLNLNDSFIRIWNRSNCICHPSINGS